jgi:drug/metabolite transporter (DMT)-like permease
MGSRLTGRGTEPLALSAAQLLAATALSSPAVLIEGSVPTDLDVRAVAAVTVLGVFSTGLTFYLSYRLIADERATSAATVGYLLPVVAVALGAVVLDEDLGLRVIAGAAVVLAGVAATRWRGRHGRHGRRGTAGAAEKRPAPAGAGRG